MSRIEKLLARVEKENKILEIGPGYNPCVRRQDGWNCFSLDHGTMDELKAKYATAPGIDVKNFQPVDFVWRDGPLESAVATEHIATFDVCIASHVIEHTPDLVAFFKSVSRLLKPRGILSLAVPDKRFCFDYFLPLTLTGDVLEAHVERRTRHSKKALYNSVAYNVLGDGAGSWMRGNSPAISFVPGRDVHTAKRAYDEHRDSENALYADAHAWYFTPSTFRLICLELFYLRAIDFLEVEFFGTTGCEFHVCLQKRNPAEDKLLPERRMKLLKEMLIDLREQTETLLGRSNAPR
jgi:SAM-dependent methyltransferase